MPDHNRIYKNEAEKYQLLIAKQPKLDKVIEEIRACHELDIVDIGAGTGRLTTALAPYAATITSLDASASMLQVIETKLNATGISNWTTILADNRRLPLEEQSADVITAGWTIGYLANADVDDWKNNLHEVITEMKRVLRPNGTIIIFETMGTGTETPNPPDFLKEYYSSLVERYGFAHKWIRMDYEFESIQQAEELTRFFFGDELASKVLEQNLMRVPECAGIWCLHT
ncbi:MAG: class I SAM-dependent methyltransferase [Candidatus Pristimantibacillus sp.]